eukprot:GEZU01043462.1.p1 GENE.GEZU01043462.1~~GEZU01043462.1.p1  ORF type:complete len:174 (+),score=31.29 GEZU01043462.1:94-615(+)
MKVVVAVDGSDHSWKALERALIDMDKETDEIILYHVVDPDPQHIHTQQHRHGHEAEETREEISQDHNHHHVHAEEEALLLLKHERIRNQVEEAEKYMREMEEECKAAGVKHVMRHMDCASHIGQRICDFAEEQDADVLYIGSRGRGPVTSMLLGSISNYCSANATTCSVEVVR